MSVPTPEVVPLHLPPQEGASPPSAAYPLRLWPGIVVVLVQLAMTKLPVQLGVEHPMILFLGMLFGPVLGAIGLVCWWLGASRIRWRDRLLVLAAWAGGAAATYFLCHATMRGMGFVMLALPTVSVLWVGWLLATWKLAWPVRRWGLIAVLLGTWAYYALLRIDGMTGSFVTALNWRWSQTAEERYLAQQKTIQGSAARAPSAQRDRESVPQEADAEDWPSFRGDRGTGSYSGPPIAVDWARQAPRLIWKHDIGPGWSSFCVVGSRLFTQEQRGEDEVVVCYDAETGEPIWAFGEKGRFYEVVAGAGPRATPTFHAGRIYAVSALGKIHCLDAATGQVAWSSPIVTAAGVKPPEWGYASSPVIAGSTVVVLPGQPTGEAVVGFDAATGKRLWAVGDGKHSYTSAQRATLAGVDQVLALTSEGLSGIDPAAGRILWSHAWPANGVARCVQPYVENDTVLISTYFGVGSRKINVRRNDDQWQVDLVWESKDMKPYFNDLVVQDGYAYGFDGNIFCCLNLENGRREWKGGRYGSGQVLLLERQKLLLVLSEQGEVVLLEATPRERKELGRFPAIEGKTWNHPVVARGKLFVRNGEQIACFDVSSGPAG